MDKIFVFMFLMGSFEIETIVWYNKTQMMHKIANTIEALVPQIGIHQKGQNFVYQHHYQSNHRNKTN